MAFRENLEQMARIYEGVAIFSVEKGSTTHRAGVRAGDILMSVNGRRIRHHSEYGQARDLRSDMLELVVIRAGRELQLWAEYREPMRPANDVSAPETVMNESQEPVASVGWRGAA